MVSRFDITRITWNSSETPLPPCMSRASRANGTPGDAGARHVEAAKRAGEPLDVRQQVLLGHEGVVEHDLAGDRGAQRQLALDLRGREALGAALDEKAMDDAVELRPDDRQ